MRQRAPGSFDGSGALGGRFRRQHAVLLAGDFRVAGQLDPAFGGIQQLDEPRPVRGQSVVDRLAAERIEEPFIFDLGQGRGHAVGGVQPRQRSRLVHARIDPVDKSLPADLFQIGKLQIAPRLDPFGDVLPVVGGGIFCVLLPIRSRDANQPVVEIHMVVFINGAHIVGAVDVDIAGDQVQVVGILEDQVVEQLERELGELRGVAAKLEDFLPLLFVDAVADAAGQAPVGMHLAAADHLDQVMAVAAHFQHLAGDVQADFLHDAQDIPLRRRGGRPDDEIRSSQRVKVRRMIRRIEDTIKQLAELLGQRRRIDVKQGVERLGRGHVMRLRADAADAIGQVGHVLGRTPHAKLLKSSQLGNLQIDVGNVPLVVEKNVDFPVAFQASDRIDGYAFHE